VFVRSDALIGDGIALVVDRFKPNGVSSRFWRTRRFLLVLSEVMVSAIASLLVGTLPRVFANARNDQLRCLPLAAAEMRVCWVVNTTIACLWYLSRYSNQSCAMLWCLRKSGYSVAISLQLGMASLAGLEPCLVQGAQHCNLPLQCNATYMRLFAMRTLLCGPSCCPLRCRRRMFIALRAWICPSPHKQARAKTLEDVDHLPSHLNNILHNGLVDYQRHGA
jgi:hypothetical protein